MSESSPFSRYAEQAGNVARYMRDDPGMTSTTRGDQDPGSLNLFRWAGRYAHLQVVRRLGDSVPIMLRRPNVLYGMIAISQFVYMSATKAHASGIGPEEYSEALTHPATFAQTLGAIATYDNRVAQGLELSYGLRARPNVRTATALYEFADDGSSINLRDMDRLAMQYRAHLERRGKIIKDDAVCFAHRAHALVDIYGALAPVYADHPMLGGAIFDETPPVSQLPAAFIATPAR